MRAPGGRTPNATLDVIAKLDSNIALILRKDGCVAVSSGFKCIYKQVKYRIPTHFQSVFSPDPQRAGRQHMLLTARKITGDGKPNDRSLWTMSCYMDCPYGVQPYPHVLAAPDKQLTQLCTFFM